MDFKPFDTKKMDEYAARARASWGATPEYAEYEEKSGARTPEANAALNEQMMGIFAEFGAVRDSDPSGSAARELVKKLQGFITAHFYTCSDERLRSLGMMYAAGGEFTANIDARAGEGTAVFVHRAIDAYCRK